MERKIILAFISFLLSIILFISIIILGFISIISPVPSLIPLEYFNNFIAVLPGPIFTDILLLYGIPIAFFLIHHYSFTYFTRFWKVLHSIYRRNTKYGFIKVGDKVSFYKIFLRAFYMGLFSFSITTLISSFSGVYLFRAGEPLPGLEVLFTCEDIFLGSFLIAPITILIFFPLWQMEDSGLVSYRHIPKNRRTPDIEGVHALLYRLLKGYAGLSTIISLIYYIYMAFTVVGWNFSEPAILTPLILIVLPFLVSGLLYFPFYIYEKLLSKNSNRLRKTFKKLNEIKIPKYGEIIVE